MAKGVSVVIETVLGFLVCFLVSWFIVVVLGFHFV